jgi:hypothetical protein
MLEKVLLMILDLEAEQAGDQLELVSLKLIKKLLWKIVFLELLITINNHKISYAMGIGLMIFMLRN